MGCDPQAPAVMASAWPPSLVRNGDAAPLASWSVDSAGTPPSPAIHTNMEFGEMLDDLRGIMVSLGISEARAFHSELFACEVQ